MNKFICGGLAAENKIDILKKIKNLFLVSDNEKFIPSDTKHLNRAFTKNEFLLSRPWLSENIWRKLCEFYNSFSKPVRILEYGSGISTFYHLENLKNGRGGELVSVEHDLNWYSKLKNSFRIIYSSENSRYQENEKINPNGKSIDWSFSIPISTFNSGGELTFRYLYRQNRGRTGCGTFEEFRDYITAPSGKFDTIIIDGRARKSCLNYVLKNQLLTENGLLVLMESGRGHPSWPKKDQLTGTYNYQPEINILLKMGAELINGTGFENWENWIPNRTKHKYFSEYCPMEALFWYNNHK